MGGGNSVQKEKVGLLFSGASGHGEGLCVQLLHLVPFGDEPASIALMDAYLAENRYVNDLSEAKPHHEIYLSDAKKVAPEKRKTVIRHPIKQI